MEREIRYPVHTPLCFFHTKAPRFVVTGCLRGDWGGKGWEVGSLLAVLIA